jgi:hypothetical protein
MADKQSYVTALRIDIISLLRTGFNLPQRFRKAFLNIKFIKKPPRYSWGAFCLYGRSGLRPSSELTQTSR